MKAQHTPLLLPLVSCAWLMSPPTHRALSFDLAGHIVEKEGPVLPPQVANRMKAGNGLVYTVPLPIAILFEKDFPAESVVREAAQWWNEQMGAQVFIDGRYAEGETLAHIIFSWDTIQDPQRPDVYELAITSGGAVRDDQVRFDVVTFYANWLTENRGVQQSVARHELGHVMGIDHSSRPNCLMFWQVQEQIDGSPQVLCPEEKELAYDLVCKGFGGKDPATVLPFLWPAPLNYEIPVR